VCKRPGAAGGAMTTTASELAAPSEGDTCDRGVCAPRRCRLSMSLTGSRATTDERRD
jgi:hypothetical protein